MQIKLPWGIGSKNHGSKDSEVEGRKKVISNKLYHCNGNIE
jgi:hypothetical protein